MEEADFKVSYWGHCFFMACNMSSWRMLVYRNVTSIVANMVVDRSLSMELIFFRKPGVLKSFKKLAAQCCMGIG